MENPFPSGLIKSALNYGKRYLLRVLSDFVREWALDDYFEDDRFQ
ncbi:MAG: hypothetical protein ACXAC8_10415 [Candidatus Hodarchaeales archaeon]